MKDFNNVFTVYINKKKGRRYGVTGIQGRNRLFTNKELRKDFLEKLYFELDLEGWGEFSIEN